MEIFQSIVLIILALTVTYRLNRLKKKLGSENKMVFYATIFSYIILGACLLSLIFTIV